MDFYNNIDREVVQAYSHGLNFFCKEPSLERAATPMDFGTCIAMWDYVECDSFFVPCSISVYGIIPNHKVIFHSESLIRSDGEQAGMGRISCWPSHYPWQRVREAFPCCGLISHRCSAKYNVYIKSEGNILVVIIKFGDELIYNIVMISQLKPWWPTIKL